MKITRVLGLAVGILVAQFTATGNAANNHNVISALGMNTNEVMDMNASVPFVDLFKLSAPFEENKPWLTKGHILYDQFGWPKQLNGGQAGTRFIRDLPANTIPTGRYTVLYDGSGNIKYGGNTKLVKREAGKDIIHISPGKKGRITSTLTITESDPRNYVRNIRILFPGGICMGDSFKRVMSERQCGSRKFLAFEQHHEQILFNPDYLNFMKDFRVIRFMNMSGITRNDLSHWSRRPNMMQATWGGKEGVRGAPLEVMVELANQLNADPWFNIPHMADNAFVQNYARYVRDNLRPGLKAYIEYTNEAWNGIFSQSHYLKRKGMAMKLDRNRDQAGHKYYARRSVEVFKMWEQVFGGTDRLVRVMGGLTTNTKISATLLDYQDAYKHTDALAIAPYFYISQKRVRQIRDVNTIFRELKSTKNPYSVPSILKVVGEQAKLAKQFGVDLIAYEGGQHLVAYKTHTVREGPNPALINANKDRRMAQLYYEFLQGWKNAGGKTFVAFSAPRMYTWIGSWGIKEHINQPTSRAPKYQSLLSFNKNQPCWWAGCRGNSRYIRKNAPAVIAKAPQKPSAERPRVNFSNPAPVRVSHRAPARPLHRNPKQAITEIRSWNSVANQGRYRIARVKNPNKRFGSHDPFVLKNIISGKINGSQDLGAIWKASWDQRYLHLLVEVRDDNLVKDSHAPWSDDSIEILIDADASKHSSFDRANDFQLMYRLNDKNIGISQQSPRRSLTGIKKQMRQTRHGYILETSIPWQVLGARPQIGKSIGIDIHVNDDDNGRNRDGKLAWHATGDQSWQNPSLFGTLVLSN